MIGRTLLVTLALSFLVVPAVVGAAEPAPAKAQIVSLPKPDVTGKVTLEKALATRRSVREYAPGALTLPEVSQILWAAHGITGPGGKRTTPSARAVYPLQVWLVAHDVTGLPPGIYRYVPQDHALAAVAGDGTRAALLAACGQPCVEQARAIVAVVGDSALAADKFRTNGARWLSMEAGFVVQNVYLEATALGLGTVMVGGFDATAARPALGAPAGWDVLALMPIGRRK